MNTLTKLKDGRLRAGLSAAALLVAIRAGRLRQERREGRTRRRRRQAGRHMPGEKKEGGTARPNPS